MAEKKTYWELLKDPRWQKKRLEILERDEFTCQRCYDSESTLHVHHKHYHKGRKPWEYEAHELVTLCETCHEGIDEEDAGWKDVLARMEMDGPCSKLAALSMVAGWAYLASGGADDALRSHFKESPHDFRLGEIAWALGCLTADDLWDLIQVLNVDGDERKRRIRAFIDQNKKKED